MDYGIIGTVAVLGLVVGSFLGVLIMRLPRHESILGRSRCESCDRTLSPIDLVPVVSWLASRARCRHCGARVSAFYPAIELASAGIALWGAYVVPIHVLVPTCLLGWILLTLAITDWRALILPDALTAPLALLGLAVTGLTVQEQLPDHILAGFIGGALLWLVGFVFRRLRGIDGLGLGDVKLFAAAGFWVGSVGLVSVLLVATVSALCWAIALAWYRRRLERHEALPFGAFLCLAVWLVWLYGPLQLG